MPSSKTALRYQIESYSGDAFPLTAAHFRLERLAFGRIRQCPATYEDFVASYRGMTFVVCSVADGEDLVAFKLLDTVSKGHYHSFITVVLSSHRKRGIAQAMSEHLCAHLSYCAPFFLTKFSVPETWVLEFESPRLRRLSTADELGPKEQALLTALASHWNSKRIRITRIQKGYYDYCDGTTGDALFKAYEIDEEDSQQARGELQDGARERVPF